MPTERTKVIQSYVTPDELQRIREIAAHTRESMSEYVRSVALGGVSVKITGPDGEFVIVRAHSNGEYIGIPDGWKLEFLTD